MNMNTRLRDWVGRVIQGALVGALGGAVLGAVEGAFVGLLGWAVVGAVVGTVVGTILGAVLGAMLGALVGAVLGVLLVGMLTGAQGKLIPMILTDGVAIYFIEDSNVQPLYQDFAVISVEARALADGINVEMNLELNCSALKRRRILDPIELGISRFSAPMDRIDGRLWAQGCIIAKENLHRPA